MLICISILSISCIEEIDITEFTNQYDVFEPELRVEALMLPQDNTAIIRIDKTIAIDDASLFDCIDDNNNWVGSECVCNGVNVDESGKDEYYDCEFEINISDCAEIGGLWLENPNPFLDGLCDLSYVEKESCNNYTYVDNRIEWMIKDDVGSDGLLSYDSNGDGDYDDFEDFPPDEDGTEGNGIPDCGEPNVDDLEEITESGNVHMGTNDCEIVKITYNDNIECKFAYSENAGTIFESSGLLDFSDGTGCQGGEVIDSIEELNELYYSYGAWVPIDNDDDCPADFFSQYENGAYNLYIKCGDEIITNNNPESIPHPIVFIDEIDATEENIGACVNESNIYECLTNYEIDATTFSINTDDFNSNYILWVSTSTWYQAVQYFDPYYSCFPWGATYPSWTYYHGHPVAALPPGDETNHFPSGNSPIIYTSGEVVVSSTDADVGCYQYKISTFSDGYESYYFYSQLDLKDPVRSNLRKGKFENGQIIKDENGDVVIGAFGAMSGNTISIDVLPQ